ncbi:tetratricopeptide repeat protein [Streptomyces sp. NPDC003635]
MFKGRLAGIGVGEYTSSAHKQLDHAVADVDGLAALLGGSFEGEPLRNPSEAEARDYLEQLPESLPADSALVLAWSGHANLPAPGALRLLAKDSGTRASSGLGLTDVVLYCAESGANQLLFVLDTCFSGDGISADDLASQIMRDTEAAGQLWVGVVTSCLPLEKARDGLFGQRFRKVLAVGPDLPELRMRWSVHNQYVRGDDVCDAVLKEWGSGAQTPDFRSRGSAWWMFPNPLYEAGAPERVVEHLLRAARSGASVDEQSWFTGRTAEVNQVVEWVREGRPGLHVVTGSAGTGKSAILGRVVSLSNPEERERLLREGREWSHALPEERSVAAHVHARGLTADLAADQFAGQLVRTGLLPARETRRNASELVGEVQRAVEEGAAAPVLVMDGLDEARGEAFKIADELLARVAPYAVVVVSTRDMHSGEEGRPGLVGTLAPEGAGLDLDEPEVQRQGLEDLREYVRLRLSGVDQRMDAGAVAGHLFTEGAPDTEEAQHTFLLARLVADQLSAAPINTSVEGWEAKVSHSVEEALDSDLAAVPAASVELARSLLRALTWAFGAGFPEDEWLSVANVEAPEGVEVTREDISWVLEQLGRHVVQDGEGGVAVYRMAHQSLADHLRPRFRGSAEEPFNPQALAVAETLVGLYRKRLVAGTPADAPFYLWHFTWRHAADAGPEGLALLRALVEDSVALLPDIGLASELVANRFEHWGKDVEAVAPTQEALALYRALAEGNPDYRPELAMALINLSIAYGNLGRHSDALPLTEESLALYQTLAHENPAYGPELAMALNNLGNRYSNLGRHDEALPPAEEAVRLRRTLTEANPAQRPNLASALNNLGIRYGNLGRLAEALAPAEEAIEIYRALADESPAFRPELASALNNLGIRYGDLGRQAEALSLVEEAVTLYDALAEDNPAHLPSLADALNNLGTRYSTVGRHAEAVPPTERSVRLRRALAATSPAAHLPNLASALSNLGVRYSGLALLAEAVVPAEEAIEIYRGLVDDNAAYRPDLAGSLDNLSNHYSNIGRHHDALELCQEAAYQWGALAEANPAYLPNLARSLANLANRFSLLGRHTEALPLSKEAVDRWRALAAANPALRSDLASALNNLGSDYDNLGHYDEAIEATAEAIGIYRPLAMDNRAHLHALAGALNNFGSYYSNLGRYDDALEPTKQAIGIHRALAEDNPNSLRELAGSLHNLGAYHGELGRHLEALQCAEEAVGRWRTLASTHRIVLPDLAAALHSLGIRYGDLGLVPESLAAVEESIALYRTLVVENPAELAQFANTLVTHAAVCEAAGGSPEGLWPEVLGEVGPDLAVKLLLSRSTRAVAGEPRAAAWLAEAQEQAALDEGSGLLWVLHSEGRRHRAAGPERFDRAWQEFTGAPPPAWLTLDPDRLAEAWAWIDTGSYEAERDYLAAHPQLLAPEADACVEDVLLGVVPQHEADRYRTLRRAAQVDGVDSAYGLLVSFVLSRRFAQSSVEAQRSLLAERRDELLDDVVLDRLSDEEDVAYIRAEWLLRLARIDREGPAFDALEDPTHFTALLHDAVRQPDTVVVTATAVLAAISATEEALAAEAEFHLAIAAVISEGVEAATPLLDTACDLAPDKIPSWIDVLAEVTLHHPAARTLIPHLTARLRRPSRDDH